MLDVGKSRAAGLAAVPVFTFLCEQIVDPNSTDVASHPQFSRLGMRLVNIVPEVLGHGRPSFSKGKGQAAVEMIIRRHAVGDGLSLRHQNVASDFMNHALSLPQAHLRKGLQSRHLLRCCPRVALRRGAPFAVAWSGMLAGAVRPPEEASKHLTTGDAPTLQTRCRCPARPDTSRGVLRSAGFRVPGPLAAVHSRRE